MVSIFVGRWVCDVYVAGVDEDYRVSMMNYCLLR